MKNLFCGKVKKRVPMAAQERVEVIAKNAFATRTAEQ
jgi:hypothetical protein